MYIHKHVYDRNLQCILKYSRRSNRNRGFHTKTKLYMVELKSSTGKPTYRHSIFLEKAFVEDSLFPFKQGDNLVARIENNRITIAQATD
jgi:hypothetical protein